MRIAHFHLLKTVYSAERVLVHNHLFKNERSRSQGPLLLVPWAGGRVGQEPENEIGNELTCMGIREDEDQDSI